MQDQIDKPNETFNRLFDELINEFDASNNIGIGHHTLGPDCKKARITSGQIVIDMFYYPINEHENRDWYDITISSVKENAHFIGSLKEFGKHVETFKKILGLIKN